MYICERCILFSTVIHFDRDLQINPSVYSLQSKKLPVKAPEATRGLFVQAKGSKSIHT